MDDYKIIVEQELCDTILPSCQRFVADSYPCRHNFGQKSAKCLRIPEKRRTFALWLRNHIASVKRQQTESSTIKNYKIMTKKNEMSARALTKEEMEKVNGGFVGGRGKFGPKIK